MLHKNQDSQRTRTAYLSNLNLTIHSFDAKSTIDKKIILNSAKHEITTAHKN